MRDTEFNVKIDVLITGDYPGWQAEGGELSDPRVAIRKDGVMLLPVNQLVDLKLTSGSPMPTE